MVILQLWRVSIHVTEPFVTLQLDDGVELQLSFDGVEMQLSFDGVELRQQVEM